MGFVKTFISGTPEYDVNKQLSSLKQVLAKIQRVILFHPMKP